MAIEHLQEILKAFNNKLGTTCPKSIKTSLSLINKYQDKLTKHRKKRILKVLSKVIHDIVEMKHSNEEHFKKEGLDDLVDSLVKQSEEFENEVSIPKKIIDRVMLKIKDIGEKGFGLSSLNDYTKHDAISDFHHVLKNGLLGTYGSGADKFIDLKNHWYNFSIRGRKGVLFGNIVGRDVHLDRGRYISDRYFRQEFGFLYTLKGYKETMPYHDFFGDGGPFFEKLKTTKRNHFWARGPQLHIVEKNPYWEDSGFRVFPEADKFNEGLRELFNFGVINDKKLDFEYSKFIEILIKNKHRIQELNLDAEFLIKSVKEAGSYEKLFGNPHNDDGFVIGRRIAPRRFCALVWGRPKNRHSLVWGQHNYSGLEREERELPELQSRLGDIVKVMKQVSDDTRKDRYLPIYDNWGNLWWPKKMSYEEVKKFIKSK